MKKRVMLKSTMGKNLLVVFSLILLFPLVSATLTDDLIAYWNFDENTGNLIDQQGIFDGTLINGVTQGETGVLNNAYNFDGTNDYINIGNKISLTEQASFSFWINAESTTNHRVIISKRKGDWSGNDDWLIQIYNDEIRVLLWGTNVVTHFTPFSTTNEWKHIVVTYDGVSVKIYIDNKKVYDKPNSGDINDNAQSTMIGDSYYGDSFYKGQIDEFGIWSRALTEEEISVLYNNQSAELRQKFKEVRNEQRWENLKKWLVFLLIFTLASVFIFYFHRKGKKKRKKREAERLERERIFERNQIKKGLTKFIDRFGTERWGKPEEIKTDEEAKEKEKLINRIIEEIEEFEPIRKYKNEFPYQIDLTRHLKSKFPNADIEQQKGSSRPDIVVEDVAIEVKGPTRTEDLKTIADKCMRYYQHFGELVIVLFDVEVKDRYYDEWLQGVEDTFPNVKIIRKENEQMIFNDIETNVKSSRRCVICGGRLRTRRKYCSKCRPSGRAIPYAHDEEDEDEYYEIDEEDYDEENHYKKRKKSSFAAEFSGFANFIRRNFRYD